MKTLSIIGIILLCLLVLFCIVLLLILFFPLTYKAYGRRTVSDMELKIKVRWLFGFIRADYQYPKPGNIVIKSLFFTLYDSGRKAEDKDSVKSSAIKENKEEHNIKEEELKKEAIKETDVERIESSEQDISMDEEPSEIKQISSHTEGEDSQEDKIKSKNPFRRLAEAVIAMCQKIKFTIKKIYDKIKEIFKAFDYYKELFEQEETQILFKYVKKRILGILKSIKPKKINADIEFGTGSPDSTGYIFGLYSMLLPFEGQNVYITPNFEELILEGDFYIKGHITVFTVAWNTLRLLLNRNIRLFIKRLKREEYVNGR